MGGLLGAGLSPEVIALVVLCIAAAALALVGAVRAGQDPARRVELLAGPVAVGLVGVGVSALLWTGWNPSDGEQLLRRAVSHAAACFVLPMVALPAVVVSVAALGWSAWKGPKRAVGAAWVLLPGLAAALAVAAAGAGQPDMVFSLLRAGGVVGVSVGLAVGCSRDDDEGPALRAMALAVLLLVVAGLESSHGGLITLLTVRQVDTLTPDTWAEGLAAFDALVARPRLGGWSALGLVALVASGAALRAPRAVQLGVGLATGLAVLLLGLSRPSAEHMQRLSVLCEPVEDATSR